MKKKALTISLCVVTVLLILICAFMPQKKVKKITSFELYNTIKKQMKEDEVTEEKLKPFIFKRYTNEESLQLINTRLPNNNLSIWKGHIFGIVHYEDGSSAIIRISRYAAFFYELKEGQLYVLEGAERDKWFNMIDNFITEYNGAE